MTMPPAAAPPHLDAALSVRGLGVSFGGVRALDGVDLDVRPGEIVGLIGANGAGKTTLFDCVSGFVPGDGTVHVSGKDVTSLAPHLRARAGLGRSFQDARMFTSMTVLDTLRVASELVATRPPSVAATLLGVGGTAEHEREATAKAMAVVESFGLGAYRDKLIGELSTGTRRVVDLAALVLHRPTVILLDEPSSGIAQREAEALRPLLRQIRDDLGCALLVIEHDMPLLLGLAERLYALETGRIIASGQPDDVVADPRVVRSYLGDDPAAVGRSH
ncbi:MAG TPA: ABC transporter ATP-binding protein [Mycobacteriales bacterium]|nr:ABC transporter ATP-binding protein [Mycobacteriales bacterium]